MSSKSNPRQHSPSSPSYSPSSPSYQPNGEDGILTPAQLEVHNRLNRNLEYAASVCGKIIDKEGNLRPFIFNRAQRALDAKCEDMLKRKGMVRLVVVKGRQMGSSTYINFRYLFRSTRHKGKSTFILSHEASTTDKLFKTVKRFYDNMPEILRPELENSNRKELKFEGFDSEYYVGTAGNEKVGVGGTVQFFHGSEVALWPNDKEIIAGLLQSIGRVPGTEIIFESTARGMGNRFYELAIDGVKGKGDYETLFIPWYWDETYRAEVPEDFIRTDEEEELIRDYGADGLCDDEQLQWRRLKIIELKELWLFRREYPNNMMEAFQTSAEGLIKPHILLQARKTVAYPMPFAARILGVDPAGDGDGADRTVLSLRQGRNFLWYKKYDSMRPMELASIVASLLEKEKIDACFIDYGHGFGTVDRLWDLGWRDVVFPVHFNSTPNEPDRFGNKRAEIGISVKEWLEEGGCSVPDDEEMYADFISIPKEKDNNNGLKMLESRAKIKTILKMSPDIFFSFALTFTAPVKGKNAGDKRKNFTKVSEYGKRRVSPLSTLNYVRGRVRSNTYGEGNTIQTLNWIGRG